MSRSGYDNDGEYLHLYRGTVTRISKGKRGQAFFRELAESLDAIPVKELIQGELVNEKGQVCAIGAVCRNRVMDVSQIDCYDPYSVGGAVGIPWQLAAEIEYMNDEWAWEKETPAERWQRMRKWVQEQIR